MGFINYCKVSLLTSKHVRTDLCISSSSILPFEIKGLSNSSMCLHLPVWPTCKETHPTLPIAGYFAHVQDSLLLLISICIRAHLFPNKRPTRLPLREGNERSCGKRNQKTAMLPLSTVMMELLRQYWRWSAVAVMSSLSSKCPPSVLLCTVWTMWTASLDLKCLDWLTKNPGIVKQSIELFTSHL